MRERIRDGLLERHAGVRYPLASHPLAGHPAIKSVYNLQPEVIPIRFHPGHGSMKINPRVTRRCRRRGVHSRTPHSSALALLGVAVALPARARAQARR
jgi:pyruvate carboxylase